ncbi:hypothetical protein ACRALDRAFT_1078420 [Sodiomyces alcalophilus JCM 7366]|uniref:uncharacterized protein n=1 Tax=Sodiomyces alcalophilus JCM 7366 TaxID=591952 RepID=UPI0039B3C552
MSKRQLRDVDGPNGARKRQRIVHETPTSEEIHTARQLRQLLAFDQDLKKARHGIQSLKVFLDNFGSDTNDDDDNQQRLALLREYLESEKPRIASEDAVFLSDLMETWAFGSQVHNDSITAAVPAVLALLLQIISGSLELLPHATGISQTLLQDRQLKLISRNLSASKGSGFIISPTLRLLREIASLDGGALARRLFRARDFTFAAFARNLEVRNSTDSGPEDPTKPSVRTNAIKLLMTCLKFLPGDAKKELLMQKEVVSHLTFLLKDDPPYLIVDMLQTLKKHVLMDDQVAREVKFRTFGIKTLDRLAGLYTYRHDEEAQGRPSVKDAVHDFLTHACTTPGAGILYTGTGLYPKDAEDGITQDVKDSDDFALERVGWLDKYRDEVPVANFVLNEFIQKTRPWSSLRHSELMVAIFGAAPELVASYFLANSAFSFEPKLSMTWIGYAAFIFNTVQLPIPRYFGNRSRYHRIPPPTLVLLGNILPAPLKQKDLVRSLSHDSNLISFFAIRILILALQKLREALRMHREAAEGASNKSIWEAAARRLLDEFCQRIPDMKEVTKCYKAIPTEENVLQREAASRLLLLYYEVIPQMALMANYDVSSSLLDALSRLHNNKTSDPQEQALGLMELENLLAIAGYSPGMRWFSKAEGLGTSPFVALLRVYAGVSQGGSLARLREVLEFVSTQNQIVQAKTGLGLFFCVPRAVGRKNGDMLWKFLDNCMNRCAASPLKYMDLMEEMIETGSSEGPPSPVAEPVSLVLVTMVEQAPFAAKDASPEQMEALVKVLSSFLGYAKRSGENAKVIDLLTDKVNSVLGASASGPPSSKVKPRFKAALLDDDDDDSSSRSNETGAKTTRLQADDDAGGGQLPTTKDLDDDRLEAILRTPFHPEEDNSALSRWVTKTIDDLVDGEYIPGLMRLLWSEHMSIRQEALTNLLKMAAKIKESSYEEKDQLWLLLSELAESSKALVPSGPVASPLVAFAVHSVDIIKNPLHCLYPKLNMYLTRSPVWAPDKIPLAHDIFHGEPSPDDRYYTEVSWLLSYLLDALRTRADLSVFHHKKWFEKILGLAANPYIRTNLVTRVLRIVYRATEIEGGSTTLVTRFGIVSWLEAQEAVRLERGGSEDEARLLRALRRRVWETCDQERVGRWSQGEIGRVRGRVRDG